MNNNTKVKFSVRGTTESVKHTTTRVVKKINTQDKFVVQRIYQFLNHLEINLVLDFKENGLGEILLVAVGDKKFVEIQTGEENE